VRRVMWRRSGSGAPPAAAPHGAWAVLRVFRAGRWRAVIASAGWAGYRARSPGRRAGLGRAARTGRGCGMAGVQVGGGAGAGQVGEVVANRQGADALVPPVGDDGEAGEVVMRCRRPPVRRRCRRRWSPHHRPAPSSAQTPIPRRTRGAPASTDRRASPPPTSSRAPAAAIGGRTVGRAAVMPLAVQPRVSATNHHDGPPPGAQGAAPPVLAITASEPLGLPRRRAPADDVVRAVRPVPPYREPSPPRLPPAGGRCRVALHQPRPPTHVWLCSNPAMDLAY
jgi:hypothetical protein